MKKIFSFLMAALFSASMFASTYVVAGAQEIMGSNWNKDDANNQMALVDGVYKLVKEGVTLGASTYDYKVIKDGDWDVLNKDNRKLNIAEDGVYDITFTLVEDPLEIKAEAVKKGSAVIEKHYLVVGEAGIVNGAAWNNDNADNLMASNDGGATYKLQLENLTLDKKNYEYKIVEKGTWTAYYDDGNGGNAKFAIEEAGIYTIEYVFTVAGSTCVVNATKTGSVDPQPEAKYYVTGDSAFVVDAGLEAAKAWNSDALKSEKDTFELNLKAGQAYKMKIVVGSDWLGYPALSEKTDGLSADDDKNICFSLSEAGKVQVVYFVKDEVVTFKLIGNFYVYVPAHANGLYLMSSHNEWAVDDNYMFASTEVDGEYKLNVTLAKDQEIKPAYVENDAAKVWYPAEGGNYTVTEAYAGDMTIYFRPAGNEDPAWVAFGGYMYITPNGGTGINNTAVEGKAVKSISNGMIVIEKNGVKFNVLGTVVR